MNPRNIDADYVIVGAGSAGCVVAEVLSRNPNTRVLVVEAGNAARFNPWTKIPLGFGKTYADPKVNWCYTTALDPGLGRKDFWPRGRVWGGSSAINGLVWVRPFPSDIDGHWPGGWKGLRPHFDAIENRAGVVGREGPVPVQSGHLKFSARDKALMDHFCAAAQAQGLARVEHFDFSGFHPLRPCVGPYHNNMRGGQRVDANRAFLAKARVRPNVRISSGDQVTGLERSQDGRVVGVRTASRTVIQAGKEVILCAGSIGSPALMLGAGLKAKLPQLGENLTDHLGINLSFRSRIPTTNSQLNNFWGRVKAGWQYATQLRGPLARGINPAGGFFCSSAARTQPNLQLYFQTLTTTTMFQRASTGERALLHPDPFDAFSLGLSTCQPKSRGSISLNDDGTVHIQPNSFDHPDDMAEFIEGVKFLRKLAATPPLAEIIEGEITPGTGVQSDAEIEADIRARCGTVYHPVSTCRMANDSQSGVVDEGGKVFGVEGLRVIDASIFPSQISVNTNAATMALAHKLAMAMAMAMVEQG